MAPAWSKYVCPLSWGKSSSTQKITFRNNINIPLNSFTSLWIFQNVFEIHFVCRVTLLVWLITYDWHIWPDNLLVYYNEISTQLAPVIRALHKPVPGRGTGTFRVFCNRWLNHEADTEWANPKSWSWDFVALQVKVNEKYVNPKMYTFATHSSAFIEIMNQHSFLEVSIFQIQSRD